MAAPRVLEDVPGAAADADLGDQGQDDVLGAPRRAAAAVDLTAKVLGWRCSRHWVASTCSTSLVPMPKARAPKAPCVAVWLSPQTIVMPGWVSPSSGPDDVHDARARAVQAVQRDAELAAVVAPSAHIWRAACWHRRPPCPGESWGCCGPGCATVCSGRRTARPRSSQLLERLRRGDLVDQVQVDVEHRRATRLLRHHVVVPDLVEQGAWIPRSPCDAVKSDAPFKLPTGAGFAPCSTAAVPRGLPASCSARSCRRGRWRR